MDVRALITTGSTLLFRVAQTERLRTYISVPHTNAPGVVVGEHATLSSVEFGTRQFDGVVTRTAGALDPATRTLVTEVQVPNAGGTLRPGMFVDVTLQDRRANPPLLIPGDALIVEPAGTRVGVLRDTEKRGKSLIGTIHLQPVATGRDYGAATEILSGLTAQDAVIVNPTDDAREGVKVQAALTKPVLDVQSGSPKQAKQNTNSERLQPTPRGEQPPKQPSKANKKRGPGVL